MRRAVQFVVCAPKLPSGRGVPALDVLPLTESGRHGGSQAPLCPLAALESEIDNITASRSCNSPTCCIVMVAEGSKLLVCQGCRMARYCR